LFIFSPHWGEIRVRGRFYGDMGMWTGAGVLVIACLTPPFPASKNYFGGRKGGADGRQSIQRNVGGENERGIYQPPDPSPQSPSTSFSSSFIIYNS